MRKYYFNFLFILFLITLNSCRKTSKKLLAETALRELIFKSGDIAPILKNNFSKNTLEKFTKNLDESYVKKLAKQVKGNKTLSSYLNKNTSAIKAWKFLSNSNYSNNIETIKYFENLPVEKFILKTNKGIGEVYDSNKNIILASLTKDGFIIKNIKNNPFINLFKYAPNTSYKLNKLNFNIDELGRVGQIKTVLLKLKNKSKNLPKSLNLIVSPIFGGLNEGINKAFISSNIFDKLNNKWAKDLSKRIKISNLSIKPSYSGKTNTPNSFNVVYYKGKERVLKFIPNNKIKTYNNLFEKLKRPAIGKKIDGSVATKTFPKGITINENKLLYEGKVFATIDAKKKSIVINRRAGLNKNNINPFLGHPKRLENYKYIVKDGKNTHTFKTDKLGRVSESEHRIVEKYSKNRNVIEQNNAKLYGDEISSKTSNNNLKNSEHKKLSDEGGHYLADSAGGIPESINITSQAYKVNHSKKWRAMEERIKKALENNENVIVKNKQIYGDQSNRAIGSRYEVIINGKSEKLEFDNLNFELEEIIK